MLYGQNLKTFGFVTRLETAWIQFQNYLGTLTSTTPDLRQVVIMYKYFSYLSTQTDLGYFSSVIRQSALCCSLACLHKVSTTFTDRISLWGR